MISFTPVRQSDDILELHLKGLDAQGFDDSWFYDDNDEPSLLLAHRNVMPKFDLPDRGEYGRDGVHHAWPASAIARVSAIKNQALLQFWKSDNEWLFLSDSDVIVPPGLVEHLLSVNMPIVSGVYWSDWGDGPRPNVWDYHPYKIEGSPDKFRKPQDVLVGGLGACTLIHRDVVGAGVNFKPVRGVTYWGEDRHFCIRASSADIPLVACSHFDVFHLYHDEQIEEARQWLTQHDL